MDLKQRLAFCKKCQKRKFSDTGIICSLTERKPDFEGNCKDFLLDPKEAQRMAAKEEYSDYEDSGSSKSIWGIIAVIFIIIRIIMRIMRD